MRMIVRWLGNAVALMFIAKYINGISIAGAYPALISIAILALINATIRPILVVFTLPITIVTLGLFTLILNGLLFWFVSSFVDGFAVSGFWAAFWGALTLSIISGILNILLPKKGR